ncbi:hypothetical protein SANTM175S_09200 [Streptomyces antimycoticus]
MAFTSAPTGDLPDLRLLRLTLTDDRGQTLSRNTYWRCRTPEALRALNQVQQAKLSAPSRGCRATETGVRTATVHNRGSMVAAMVGSPCCRRTAPGSCRRSTTTTTCGCCQARHTR